MNNSTGSILSRVVETRRKGKKVHHTEENGTDDEHKKKETRELNKRQIRQKTLVKLYSQFRKAKSRSLRKLQKLVQLKEWERYTSCSKLPIPEQPMNVRKHYLCWCDQSKYANIEQVDKDLSLYLPLFKLADDISDIPLRPYTGIVTSLREIIEEWKSEFCKKIDYACFLLIKEIAKHFDHINFYTRNYVRNFENFNIGMWSLLNVPMKSDCRRPTPVIHFPNLKVTVSLPVPYNLKPIVLRVIYINFDFFSNSSKSKYKPEHVKPLDLAQELQRIHLLQDEIYKEISEIEKGKSESLPSEKVLSHTEFDSRASVVSDANTSLFKQIFQSKDSLFSMEQYSLRSNSIRPGPHKMRSTVSYGKYDSDSLYSVETSKKGALPWESKIEGKTGRKMSKNPNRFSSDKTYSMIFENSDYSVVHTKEDKRFERWSCTDLDLLAWQDPEMVVTRSLTFMDLLFNSEDKQDEAILKDFRTIRDLVKESDNAVTLTAQAKQEMFSATHIFAQREEERYQQIVNSLTIKLEPKEVNLRKYHSFCGVYYIELFQHAEDICMLQVGNFVQSQVGPYTLKRENFFCAVESSNDVGSYFEQKDNYFHLRDVREYQISDVEVKYEEEQEKDFYDDDEEYENEINKEKCVLVKISLRQDVFWFMKPQPAIWDREKNIWSTEHVHEVTHDRLRYIVEFKLGKLGPITMFTLRFHELPYKNWTLTPCEEEETKLILVGQHLKYEFKISDDKICLNNIEGYSTHLLEGIVGQMLNLSDLVEKMRKIGLDVFPEDDTFLYVKQCALKPLALESHIYFTMALYSKSVEFTASSTNLSIGHNSISLQCRLYEPSSPHHLYTLKADILQCDLIMMSDERGSISSMSTNLGFQPDVHSTLMILYGKNTLQEINDLAKLYVIYELLQKTKILTYSGNQ
ncbi:uncharacterized protein LOC112127971 [Cimex lectularius]|uniref:Uncharacterized protein n=1 Tax=Cimex lectularius TaxID=79782 RepID=A0A8I6STQ7_CIMLE|nr:uncharacterized protein LOC112127971 [Cimex lectularius]